MPVKLLFIGLYFLTNSAHEKAYQGMVNAAFY